MEIPLYIGLLHVDFCMYSRENFVGVCSEQGPARAKKALRPVGERPVRSYLVCRVEAAATLAILCVVHEASDGKGIAI